MGCIQSSSQISETAEIDKDVYIGIGKNVKIGSRSIIRANTDVAKDVEIGENVSVGYNCDIEKNVKIGDSCILGNNIDIGAGAVLGKRVRAAANCDINGHIGNDVIISTYIHVLLQLLAIELNLMQMLVLVKEPESVMTAYLDLILMLVNMQSWDKGYKVQQIVILMVILAMMPYYRQMLMYLDTLLLAMESN